MQTLKKKVYAGRSQGNQPTKQVDIKIFWVSHFWIHMKKTGQYKEKAQIILLIGDIDSENRAPKCWSTF